MKKKSFFVVLLAMKMLGALSQDCKCPEIKVAIYDFNNTAARPNYYHGGSINDYDKNQVAEITDWQHAPQFGSGGFLTTCMSQKTGEIHFMNASGTNFTTADVTAPAGNQGVNGDVDYIVTGKFMRAGDHYVLQVQLEDAKTREYFAEQTVQLATLKTAIEAGSQAASALSPLMATIRKYQHQVRDQKNKDATAIAAKYELTAERKNVDAGGTTELKIKMYDCDDHSPLKNRKINLKFLQGKSTISPSTITTDANGEAHATFKGAKEAEIARVYAEYQYTSVAKKQVYAGNCNKDLSLTVGGRYKLKVDFEASGHGDNNGRYHALVSGEADVQCRLENNQYVVEATNGNKVEFQVKEVIFTTDKGRAVYKWPMTFMTPLSLSLSKGDNPVFKIAFGSFGDSRETYSTSEGVDFQASLLHSLAMATLASVNIGHVRSDAQNLKQKAKQYKGQKGELEAAGKRLEAHKNDPNYIQTPQGKADMALMSHMAKDMGYSSSMKPPDPTQMQNIDNIKAITAAQGKINQKMKTPGYAGSQEYLNDVAAMKNLSNNVNTNQFSNAGAIGLNLMSIEAPFIMGSEKPVDKIQKDKIEEVAGSKGGWEFGQFHIVLEK